ncbi:hypothetical protein RB195_018223 [Necator americanus]|uniref:Uncharacterized protein n=1 Tax=Necator americanus TaxID=51031 RepID=A0ABR1CBN7_NECAM
MATDKNIPKAAKFVLGGSAGMTAAAIVQPLDLLKNRMQLSGKSGQKQFKTSFHALNHVLRNEGFFALYNGLSAGLLRQATYTTTRLGIYTWMLESFTKKDKPLSFPAKASLGMAAGACGALVGTPADLALIRMTGDGHLPPEQRRNYKNVIDALFRIAKEEGILTWFRGCGPTVIRAMVVNAAQLATYSHAKQLILATKRVKDGIFCHFLASMISGLATTVASMPVDIIKTSQQVVTVGIDANAKMGLEQQSDELGKWYYSAECTSDNGDRLVDLCEQTGLIIASTFKKNHLLHQLTWQGSPQLRDTVPQKKPGVPLQLKIDMAGLKDDECRTKLRQRVSIHVRVRTRKKLSDADSFTKCIQEAARETLPVLLPRKKFAFASAETKSTYNSVCVARSAGDFNREKRLRRKLRRQLQQDRDNEWTSRAIEFGRRGRTGTRGKSMLY